MKTGALVAGVLVLVAGCGSATARASGNALVCQHYLAQRSWEKHLTYPTLADAFKLVQFVAADDAQAQPGTQLRRDLNAMSADYAANRSPYAASKRVYFDCTNGQ